MMKKCIQISMILILSFIFCLFIQPLASAKTTSQEDRLLILDQHTEKVDLYEYAIILSDNEKKLTIDDIVSYRYDNDFELPSEFKKKPGFFEVAKWFKFDVQNDIEENDWLIEFAFPLIFQIHLYEEDATGLRKMATSGAEYPFESRELENRYFVFNLSIEQAETKTYYALLHGPGDLHPPINLWKKDVFIENTQVEFTLLGLFYGMIIIMILYNLFLYFSLQIKAYLYYVLAITTTMIAQLALNGLAFQYLWPKYPSWNIIAVPFWVSIACIIILLFTKEFLDTNQHVPSFKKISIVLMGVHGLTLLLLFTSHLTALYSMVFGTFGTFISIIIVGFISLKRGVHEARFFIIGWLVFLTGVYITILERTAVIPYNLFTEYAGQGALSIEVVLLSLALADKINRMRVEKEQAEKAARESQALIVASFKKADELKDEFLAITSHELRTPLYGMTGIAESLRDGVAGKASEEMIHQLDMIVSSGKRLTHLVNDTLDFSQLRHNVLSIDLKQVNLSSLVEAVFTICEPLLKEKEVRLVNQVSANLPNVIADQDRLQQIMYNLVGNAIKYTKVGEVVVSTEQIEEKVKINIADTGIGIDPELHEEIFEPFKQGNSSLLKTISGTGIGLSVTKKLVELHGGKLTVDSNVGEGAVFSFTLPIKTGGKQIQQEVPLTLELAKYKNPKLSTPKFPLKQGAVKVLVADDELVNLQVLMNQLTLAGMDVKTVRNGEEVLQAVADDSFDVLILDIMMPNMTGYDVCEQLRKTYSLIELPIIMLTAKSQLHDKITAFEVGANDYLTKPCDREELLSRVKTLAQLKWMNKELRTLNVELEEMVKNRTKALQLANEDLSKTNKRLINMAASRRNLLANIAHELGTPVMFIHTYVQALQEGLITGGDKYYHNLVDDKIKVLNRLIHDLADLSQLEEGRTSLRLKTYNLGTWLEEVYQKISFDIQTYGRTFKKDQPVLPKTLFNCFIDVERMDQVFTNLISNAVKNTAEDSGLISIKTHIDEESKVVIIAIRDNGVGISEDMLPHIFERFYQQPSTVTKQTGSGLGLAIVKEIIQGHSGDLWVDSELNVGSTFYISLPIEKSFIKLEQQV